MIELERKKRLLRSAFSNGLDFLDGMYVINDNPIGRDEVEELASDVEAMIEWYFKCLNQEDAEQKAYQQGRADAIEEFKTEINEMKRKAYQFLNSDYATGYISALSTLEGYAEQIKEQANGR